MPDNSMAVKKYGFSFPDGTNEVTMELHAYLNKRDEDRGGLGEFEHMRNAIDLLWNNPEKPAARPFIWSPWAEDMLYEACLNKYLSIAGCASSGKSDAVAMYGIINYLAAPTYTLVLMTSTTLREARRRIWKSTMELWNAVPGLPGRVVNSLGIIKGMSPTGGYTEATGVGLIPASKSKEKEAIGKLAGIKQDRLILLADELPELPESLIHTAVNNMAVNNSNKIGAGFKMVGLGNPNSHFDAFGLFSEPREGWESVTEDDFEWETELGKCIRFDAQDNPNLIEKGKYPWMPSQEVIDQSKAMYGENSLFFYRMFKGFWCPTGTDSSIYSEADLIRGMSKRKATFDESYVTVAGLDPSFTSGGDRCIAYFGKYGKMDGLFTLVLTESVTLKEDINEKEVPRSHQLSRQFKAECLKRGVLPENAALDSTGGGAPFHDVLSVEWSDRVMAVNFAGKASDRKVSATDNSLGHERYQNKMSEIWFQSKELLRSNQFWGIDRELAKEMVSREYDTTATGKIKVESKKDYKMRTGKSPDLADSAFVVVELCRDRLGLLGGERFEVNAKRRESWAEKMKSFDSINLSTPSDLYDV